jgi:hypothetical protein
VRGDTAPNAAAGAATQATQINSGLLVLETPCTPECKPTFEYGVEDNESALERGAGGYRRAGRWLDGAFVAGALARFDPRCVSLAHPVKRTTACTGLGGDGAGAGCGQLSVAGSKLIVT